MDDVLSSSSHEQRIDFNRGDCEVAGKSGGMEVPAACRCSNLPRVAVRWSLNHTVPLAPGQGAVDAGSVDHTAGAAVGRDGGGTSGKAAVEAHGSEPPHGASETGIVDAGHGSSVPRTSKFVHMMHVRHREPAPRLHVFSDFTGELLPGRPTVMISAPGGGASTFLRLLSGRGEPQAGDCVLYNGQPATALRASGVNMQRLAAFHSEVEVHEPLLTTLETFQFAYDVLNARGDDGRHTQHWYSRLMPSHIMRGLRTGRGAPPSTAGDSDATTVASGGPEAAADGGATSAVSGSESELRERGRASTATCEYCRPKTPKEMISILDLSEAESTLVGSNMVRGISGGQRRRVTSEWS